MVSIIKGILNHPLNKHNKIEALLRFVGWQFQSRVFNTSRIVQLTEKSQIRVISGRPASTAHLYCGLFEFEDESFLMHFLRQGDLFVDIGANVGVYSILSSAHCGANSISIEPIPTTVELLKENITLNNIENLVEVRNCGVSARPGQILFTTTQDSANHAKSETDSNEELYLEVTTLPLDEIVGSAHPALIKIDVEGYENEVLAGGLGTLQNNSLKAIIIELNGSGLRYSYNDEDINSLLLSHGFHVYSYHPYSRELVESEFNHSENTLYIRDYDFVKKRLESAEAFNVRGRKI